MHNSLPEILVPHEVLGFHNSQPDILASLEVLDLHSSLPEILASLEVLDLHNLPEILAFHEVLDLYNSQPEILVSREVLELCNKRPGILVFREVSGRQNCQPDHWLKIKVTGRQSNLRPTLQEQCSLRDVLLHILNLSVEHNITCTLDISVRRKRADVALLRPPTHSLQHSLLGLHPWLLALLILTSHLQRVLVANGRMFQESPTTDMVLEVFVSRSFRIMFSLTIYCSLTASCTEVKKIGCWSGSTARKICCRNYVTTMLM